ncbi:hypothetical protein [Methylobacterium fujisawaense]|uniref:hypothetical protein n=1 Tax=Methylobacterium fujisawaense TaxID=107400 RepID=UPI00313CCD8D
MSRLLAHLGAFACALAALALLDLAFPAHPTLSVGSALGLLGVGALLCPARVCRIGRLTLALVLICFGAALILPGYARAGEFSAAGASLGVPWGDLAIEAGKVAIGVGVPPLVLWIGAQIARLFPALRKTLSDALIDRMVRLGADFALQALEGCAKGRTVPLNMGSAAVAAATARAMNSTAGFVVSQAGGAQGIAERVFRHLDLDEGATAANTLQPALAQLGVKAG